MFVCVMQEDKSENEEWSNAGEGIIVGKHAYLLMAHNDWSLLSKLLQCLDDSRNSIFIHIDKKSDFNKSDIYVPKNAKTSYIPRRSVSWGGYSQIAVELDLLAAATAEGYDYYHHISGQDVPIKSQSYIHSFFDDQVDALNYIGVHTGSDLEEIVDGRLGQHHFFQDSIGQNSGIWCAGIEFLENKSLALQRRFKVNRVSRIPVKVYKVTNWFSITHEMAQYVVSRKSDIQKWFKSSLCADELFLQAIAMDSPYKETISYSTLREIDWKRGKPYTYHIEDYSMLMESERLFARKFSTSTDSEIIEKICNKLLNT